MDRAMNAARLCLVWLAFTPPDGAQHRQNAYRAILAKKFVGPPTFSICGRPQKHLLGVASTVAPPVVSAPPSETESVTKSETVAPRELFAPRRAFIRARAISDDRAIPLDRGCLVNRGYSKHCYSALFRQEPCKLMKISHPASKVASRRRASTPYLFHSVCKEECLLASLAEGRPAYHSDSA
jgi:hypothetical protein